MSDFENQKNKGLPSLASPKARKFARELGVNINLVSFSIYLQDITGQIFTMLILTVAAAEAAIGLAIIVSYYRNKGSIRVEEIDEMKG